MIENLSFIVVMMDMVAHVSWEWQGKQRSVCVWWAILHPFTWMGKEVHSLLMGHNLSNFGIRLLWHRPVLPREVTKSLILGGNCPKMSDFCPPPFDRHKRHTGFYVKG